MHNCLILLGSNHDAEKSLPEARKYLEQILCCQHFTGIMQSEPFGGKGPSPYHNQMVQAQTTLSFEQLTDALKDIETRLGRIRLAHIVRIDLDILEYDSEKHHLRDWERPYVKQLLPQLS